MSHSLLIIIEKENSSFLIRPLLFIDFLEWDVNFYKKGTLFILLTRVQSNIERAVELIMNSC